MNKNFTNLEALNTYLNTNEAVLLYFKTQSCSVVEALEPKVSNLIEEKFSEIKFVTVDLNASPKIASNFQAFVEPTILVFFDGKETLRRSRNISVLELENALSRPYKLFFN